MAYGDLISSCCVDYYISIPLLEGSFQNGYQCIYRLDDGTYCCDYPYIGYYTEVQAYFCPLNYSFGYDLNEDCRTYVYSDGCGSYFLGDPVLNYGYSYTEDCYVLIPQLNYETFIVGNYDVFNNGSGGYVCLNFQPCYSGYLLGINSSSDLIGNCYESFRADGNFYYYSDSFYCSGVIYCTGALEVQLPDLNYYQDGTYCIVSNGVSGITYENHCSFGYVIHCYTGTNSTGNYCLSYLSDGFGDYFSSPVFYESGTFLCSGEACIIFRDSNYYRIGNYQILSDGVGSFVCDNYIYCQSGCCIAEYYSCIFLNESSSSLYVTGGYATGFSDGSTGYYEVISYCNLNYKLYEDLFYSYYSDGTGYYFVENNVLPSIQKVKVNWDFDQATKNKYVNCLMIESGCNIFCDLDLNCSKPFYEINSYQLFCLNFKFAKFCDDLEFSCFNYPFVFVKNAGNYPIIINTSPGETYYRHCENKIFATSNLTGSQDYFLCSNESMFVYFESNNNGSSYRSKVCYAFGFFNEFLNVSGVNSSGKYPSCCFNGNPLYVYEDICDFEVIQDTPYFCDYKKFRNYSLDLNVNCGIDLNLSFEKNICSGNFSCSDRICDLFNIKSYIGKSYISSDVKINCVTIIQGDCSLQYIFESGLNYAINIDQDRDIKVLYNVDLTLNKNLNYLFEYEDASGFLKNDIYVACSSICDYSFYTGVTTGCIYDLNIDFEKSISLYSCFSGNAYIKDINTKNLKKNNLFLSSGFSDSGLYVFELQNSNLAATGTSLSGNWDYLYTGEQVNCSNYFINKINFVSINEVPYFAKQDPYNIRFCLGENLKTTCDFLIKNSGSVSEIFCGVFSQNKCIYSYCCFDFEYFPMTCVILNNMCFEIPNNCVSITATANNNSVSFDYPIQAISQSHLKIANNLDIYDSINSSNININYGDFCLSKVINKCCTGYIQFNVPCVSTGSLDANQIPLFPSVDLNVSTNRIVKNNVSFYLNIFNEFNDQNSFCMNPFLRLIASKLNSGVASTITGAQSVINRFSETGCFSLIYDSGVLGSKQIKYSGYNYDYDTNQIICDIPFLIDSFFSGSYANSYYTYCYYDKIDNKYRYFNNYNISENCIDYSYCSGLFLLQGYTGINDFNQASGQFYEYINNSGSYLASPVEKLSDVDVAFLTLDLASEVYSSCENSSMKKPESIWCNILNFCRFDFYQNDSIIPYKGQNNTKYSFLHMLETGIIYTDKFKSDEGNNFEKVFSGKLNYTPTGVYYFGGSYVTGELGSIIKQCCSNFNINTNNYNMYFDSCDLLNTSGDGRCIMVLKEYDFTGIQPICITSNFALSYLSDKFLTNNLKNYSDCASGIFYYAYDIKQGDLDSSCNKLKFVSPNFTCFACITWSQSTLNCEILATSENENVNNAFILKNAAQIFFDISGIVKNNEYYNTVNNYISFCVTSNL